MVGFIRRNYLVPIPRFESFDDLNAYLEEQCLKRQGALLRGHKENIEQRFSRDLDALMKLPAAPFDACKKESTQANSVSMVRFHYNDYSVPVAYAHHDVQVRGYVHEVIIVPRAFPTRRLRLRDYRPARTLLRKGRFYL